MTDQELEKIAKLISYQVDVELGLSEDTDENFVFDQVFPALKKVRDAQEKPTIGIDMSTDWHKENASLKEKLKIATEALELIYGRCYDSDFHQFGNPAKDALQKIQ